MTFYMNNPAYHVFPETMRSLDHAHGTCVATLAAGDTYGAAPKANLQLIKTTGAYQDLTNPNLVGQIREGPSTPINYMDAFTHILADVTDPNNDKRGKAVVNMSFREYLTVLM